MTAPSDPLALLRSRSYLALLVLAVVLAALVTLCLGVVLEPEAPLIALGGGLGVIAVRLAKRDARSGGRR